MDNTTTVNEGGQSTSFKEEDETKSGSGGSGKSEHDGDTLLTGPPPDPEEGGETGDKYNRTSSMDDSVATTNSIRKRVPTRHLSIISDIVTKTRKHIKPPSSLGVLVLAVPMAAVLLVLRLRHDQSSNKDKKHDNDDQSAYSSSYSSSESSESSSYSSYGDDDASSVFKLALAVRPIPTSLCFTAIIGATMTLDFLIESLNELCEHLGDVYLQLARSLYQELMLLGIISFTIFLMNAEGYFSDKVKLFHEVEYAHIIVFYIGLGLVVQGLSLAIVNKEVKAVWKFSTEQTLEELEEQIEECKEAGFMGEWRVKHGLFIEAKQHLDIHLVRIKFLEIMNLPTNFAYNEYVNHALDETTLKIATNTWVTWLSLILLILLAAQVDQDAFFMGTNQRGYYNFLAMGLLLVLVHLGLYGVVSWQSERLMQKLGAKGDVEQEFKVVKDLWPEQEAWHDIHGELRDIEQKVIDEAKQRKLKASKLATNSLKSATQKVKGAVNLVRTAALLTAAPKTTMKRTSKTLGKRVKTREQMQKLGIDQKAIATFHRVFMRSLRVVNLIQAFYISLIMAHWGWYAPSMPLAYLELLPIFVIYIALTPRIVRCYAMVMSLGNPNPHALSMTIEYMDHNEQALHQVAELILNSKDDSETVDDVFSDWDTNGDGEISFKELQEAMFKNNMHMQKARFMAMWRKIDIDSGGTISRDEFRRALDPYLKLVETEEKVKAGMLPAGGEGSGRKPKRGSSLDRSSAFGAFASGLGGNALSGRKRQELPVGAENTSEAEAV